MPADCMLVSPDMRNTIFALGCLCLCISRSVVAEGPEPLPVDKIADKVRPSVLTVINAGREGYAQGLGTGFVISKDGLVVTNLHVVGEARPIAVELQDGRRPKVTEVVGWSRKDDLIVFRIDVLDVPPLTMGPGDKMAQGTAVVAMGNPLGLRYSVVSGVVSEVRDVEGQELIQLAMPVEKGNSGGPLVDAEGRLRGIVNMKSAVTDNLGYAIPVATLQAILANPAPMQIGNWLTIGKLNPKLWKATEATWTQRAGRIIAHGQGEGFGGRALCIYQPTPPEIPYEVSVRVKLDDASGAGGLAFCADGGDTHYGFYPTAGKLRLTRFEGPEVSSWTILQDVDSPHFQKGGWNHLRVRVEADKLRCFLNGHEIITLPEMDLRTGRVGLCKFRQTEPEFRDFRLGKEVGASVGADAQDELRQVVNAVTRGDQPPDQALTPLAGHPETSRDLIEDALLTLDKRSRELKKLSTSIHEHEVLTALQQVLHKDTDAAINLAEAALLIARLDNPDLIIADYLAELDRLAQEIKDLLTDEEKADASLRTERLLRWLFVENGYHGSRDDYYSKSNSYLNEVMDDREGLPVLLAVLFLEIGSRLDLPLAGIPVPGHFLVQLRPADAPDSGPYFDLFDRGKKLNRTQAAELSSLPPDDPLMDEAFRPATKRDTIVRILRNLIGIELNRQADAALPYLNFLLTVNPDAPSERLSRAVLLFKSDHPAAARTDVEWLKEHRPDGMDIERLEEFLQQLSRP